jgi:hypothetical protein
MSHSDNAATHNPPALLNHKQLARMRNSAVARMLAGSIWILKAWQLDLEFPPTIHAYLDQRLADALRDRLGRPIDPDTLHIHFTTVENPTVESNGEEQFDLRLSVRELGRAVLDPPAFLALKRCAEPDRPLHDDFPHFTLATLFALFINAQWTCDYETLVQRFWERHGDTWQMLATLSFLEGLRLSRRRKRISEDGYVLALDAAGFEWFPKTLSALTTERHPHRSAVHLLTLNDEPILGVLHLRSRFTGHCYVHVLGVRPHCHEYISDDAPWDQDAVIKALNASPWHRMHLDLSQAPNTLGLSEPVEDLFTQLRQAHRQFSIDRLTTSSPFESGAHAPEDEDDVLMAPIQPAMTLVSVLDHWHGEPKILDRIPTPTTVANRIMGNWLKGLDAALPHDLDAKHVFIRYLRGTSTTPWGDPQRPPTHVVVPSETPISLGQALIRNYREEHASGYTDEGGRSVVYVDASAKGVWSPEAELSITPASVEAHIDSIEFLDVMGRRLKRFWGKQGPAIERSLKKTFMAQAVLSLKNGELSLSAFNLLVTALDETQQDVAQRQTRCHALGFYLNAGSVTGADAPACVGLLLFRHKKQPTGVLYQAGQKQPFVELDDARPLAQHLTHAAADEHWRKTLLNYMPRRFHERLAYITALWGGTVPVPPPVSDLRPWTERIYNEDVYKTRQGGVAEHEVGGCPLAFMASGLRQIGHDDAEDSIVTDREVAIHHWTQQASRLQLLLAPMALLMPVAVIASLTASAASLALSVQAASLPGHRAAERKQVFFAVLSLGLLQLGPATPRLLRMFTQLATPAKAIGVARALPSSRSFGEWLRGATHSRKTYMSTFFNGTGPMKTWSLLGSGMFGVEPVRAWKLGRKFLLWTSDRNQARTLVVSSHGYYLPWTRTTAIPNGTELRTYAPHGQTLIDPTLHRVASQNVIPYSMLNTTQPVPGPSTPPFSSWLEADTLMAGTSLPGRIKNYTLAKFQSEHYESYRYIGHIVRNTQQSPLAGQLPAAPMDVLTVRNRFGMTNPTLQDLFNELNRHGIHYDKILLVHCRCSAVNSLLGRVPDFHAPIGNAPISP